MLSPRDIKPIYRLIGEVRAIGADPDRWPFVALDGLRQLVDADCTNGIVIDIPAPDNHEELVPNINYVVGLPDSDFEKLYKRNVTMEIAKNPYFVRRAHVPGRFVTVRRQDVLADDQWYGDPRVKIDFFDFGYDHFVHSWLATPSLGKSVEMLALRRIGRPPFNERERKKLRLFHLEMARLWRDSLTLPDEDRMRSLPPRQRQVLWMLCSGDSEKEVATKLALSQHTVHDYVKALHRHFEVSNRAQLVSKVLRSPHQSDGRIAIPGNGHASTLSANDEPQRFKQQ